MVTTHELEWTDEVVERFWSHYISKTHTYFAEAMGEGIVRRTAQYFGSDALCVDYGCGSGGMTAALLKANFKVLAADLSPDSVRLAASRFEKQPNFMGAYSCRQDALTAVPKADVLYSVETIEHVIEPNVAAYFANIRQLLKPGGIAIFSTPNNEDIEAAKVFCPESGALFHPMQHVRSFDETTLPTFLKQNGFVAKTAFVTDFGLNWRLAPKRWIADKAKRLLGMGMPYPHLVAIASPMNS